VRNPPKPVAPPRKPDLWKQAFKEGSYVDADGRYVIFGDERAPEKVYRRLDPEYEALERKAREAVDKETKEIQKKLDNLLICLKAGIWYWGELGFRGWKKYQEAVESPTWNTWSVSAAIKELGRIRAKLEFRQQRASSHAAANAADAPRPEAHSQSPSNSGVGASREVQRAMELAVKAVRDALAPEHVKEKLRTPSKIDWEAYRLHTQVYSNQKAVAEALTKEHDRTFTQPNVSRMLTRVRTYLEAGGQAPLLPEPAGKKERILAVDPRALDRGRNRERYTEGQRKGRNTRRAEGAD